MAQTGYTPIQIYSSSTAAAAPAAGNLTNSTLGSELAINITDGKLFYKDNAGAVQVIAWKTTPTTAGGTGLTSYTAGDLLYYATGTTLAKLTIGASTTVLTSSGSAPQWTAQSALSVGEAANLKSNATTGVMQITGPGTGTTRVMTIPNANFTVARTDAAQTFSGLQTFGSGVSVTSGKLTTVYGAGGDFVALFQNTSSATPYGVWIKDAATPAAGYPLLNISNDAGTTSYLRVDSSNGNTTITSNLVVAAAAKGVNFTSNTPAAGMTSQLLNWYEEGTWTPTSGVGSATSASGAYTRIGRQVTVIGTLTFPTQTNSNQVEILGLPFTISSTGPAGVARYSDYGAMFYLYGNTNATSIALYAVATGPTAITYTNMSGKRLDFSMTYFV